MVIILKPLSYDVITFTAVFATSLETFVTQRIVTSSAIGERRAVSFKSNIIIKSCLGMIQFSTLVEMLFLYNYNFICYFNVLFR